MRAFNLGSRPHASAPSDSDAVESIDLYIFPLACYTTVSGSHPTRLDAPRHIRIHLSCAGRKFVAMINRVSGLEKYDDVIIFCRAYGSHSTSRPTRTDHQPIESINMHQAAIIRLAIVARAATVWCAPRSAADRRRPYSRTASRTRTRGLSTASGRRPHLAHGADSLRATGRLAGGAGRCRNEQRPSLTSNA